MSDSEIRRSEMGLGLREDVGVPLVPDTGRIVESAPLKEPQTPGEWAKQNLFSGVANTIITILAGLALIWIVWKLVDFVFIGGDWEVIRASIRGYMVGSFPPEELWRVWACAYLVAALAGLSLGRGRYRFVVTPRRIVLTALITLAAMVIVGFTTDTFLVRALVAGVPLAVGLAYLPGRAAGARLRRPLITAWLLAFPVMLVIIRGFDGVAPRFWGGFFFNIMAAVVGIFASFPIGIALALGRRSGLPAVRGFCGVVIELFRGVPLVAWLIFSKFVLDLLLPPQLDLPDIVKALVMMTLFSAAYVAEIVRGGLQGINEGQYDAARAIGLSTTRMMAFIIMPQALRSTIPAMISHFISLFKDTSLFAAIQVTDLLRASQRSATNLEFLGQDTQTLAFAGLLFWVVTFSMSRWSQRLEVRLGVGER
jgi:general L-amino acid transport system permease protein